MNQNKNVTGACQPHFQPNLPRLTRCFSSLWIRWASQSLIVQELHGSTSWPHRIEELSKTECASAYAITNLVSRLQYLKYFHVAQLLHSQAAQALPTTNSSQLAALKGSMQGLWGCVVHSKLAIHKEMYNLIVYFHRSIGRAISPLSYIHIRSFEPSD